MNKYLFLTTLITFFLTINKAKAQYYDDFYREDSWHMSIGFDGLYNQNPGKAFYTAGVGAQVSAIYYPNAYVGLSVTSGYYNLLGKERVVGSSVVRQPNFQYIPLKFGVRGFVTPTWYIIGEFGAGYADPQIAKGTHFSKTIAPGFGYDNPDRRIDISLRYENMHHRNSYVSMIALQLAYSIDFSD